MTSLSPSEVAKIAAEVEEERKKLTPATHADVAAYVEALRAEVKEDGEEDVSAALLVLLEGSGRYAFLGGSRSSSP